MTLTCKHRSAQLELAKKTERGKNPGTKKMERIQKGGKIREPKKWRGFRKGEKSGNQKMERIQKGGKIREPKKMERIQKGGKIRESGEVEGKLLFLFFFFWFLCWFDLDLQNPFSGTNSFRPAAHFLVSGWGRDR